MPLLNSGRDFLAKAIVGESVTPFDAVNAYLAVGDGTDEFSATHTDLQGTNTFRKGMDSTYPTRDVNVLTYQSTFGPSEANYPWEEWGIVNASTGGTMLQRLVEYNGEKREGQTWIFQVEIDIIIS